ncbi:MULTISPECIES: dephospho-CoA kinase [unclassified Lentimicrobium]|uniref:dephospho-CoA kinase n=1 Tax=unclassified Lentimicrobium TaxID=2677434 RepID=UPI001552F8C5|nr:MULTISPECIES: dephospho-CoA kinase [unclassified Lentimicrobium]NPD44335.1 dephospho-CoA kinase [Lentimicrobium sp. S6]NPD86897.1 dephospho-CoA kinase [Lentimicrobium sp. L6]
MIKVGLTGNIGSGKTWVCQIFSALNVPIYYADLEARNILNSSETIEKIAEIFGSIVLSSTKQIDRKKLASIVFNNAKELEKLNHLIHPQLRDHFQLWAQQQKSKYVIQEAAILFENGFDHLMDKTITIASPKDIRLKRVMQRDDANEEDVLARMNNQWSDERKENAADYIIYNDGSQMLVPQVLKIHQFLNK